MKTYKILLSFFLILMSGMGFSQSVPSYVPTNGLVGWWEFNGNAQDGSGNGNHLVNNGNVLYVVDRNSFSNSSIKISSNQQYLSILNPNLPIGNSNRSLSVWYKQLNATDGATIFSQWDGVLHGTCNSSFSLQGSSSQLFFWGRCNDRVVTFPSDSNWINAVIVYDNSQIKFYKNGQLINNILNPNYYTFTTVLNTSGYELRIGHPGGNWQYPSYFNGFIDDVGFWNRALTQQEITNLYNSQVSQPCMTSVTTNHNINGCGFAILANGDTVTQSGNYLDTLSTSGGCDSILNQTVTIQPTSFCNPVPTYVPTNGLVGWWGFNGNAQDNSGNGNHGTVNGAILTTDRFGYQNSAYDFDGINDYIQTSFSGPQGNSPRTVSIWFKTSQLHTSNPIPGYLNEQMCLVSYGNSSYAGGTFDCSINHNCQGVTLDVAGGLFTRPSVTNNNLWHNLIFVYDGLNYQNVFTYYDGIMQQPSLFCVGTSHPINTGNSYPITFANYANVSTGIRHFNGSLDDIGIWNRALTPQEITNLYNSQLPTQTSLCLPTITTSSPSSVGVDTVVIGGDISNDGGSSIVLRGVCYSTSTNPNMGDQRTEDGSGTGSYSTVLRGLPSSTTYYARSYAKNSNGVVVYGNEVSFTTSASLPGVRCPGTPSVTDIDGNIYNTVQIGNQCWTQSNLKTSRYRNGDNIPTGLTNSAWGNTTSGAYGIYNNDTSVVPLYGLHYNGYAVNDVRGICPAGWQVPTDNDLTTLVNFLGGDSIAGGHLKSVNVGFSQPNSGASNSSGFSGVAAGYFGPIGGNTDLWVNSYVWSRNSANSNLAWVRYLHYLNTRVYRFQYGMTWGFSVRCLKNTLPQVNTTSVTNVTPSSALVTGEVISEGDQNTTRGFCYSTTPNPTISNDTTMNGTGHGVYSDTLQNLTPSTTYYVRAYATNSIGTSYGNEVIFTTDSIRIGSNYAGGIVFYIDSTGQHGLVCAPSDQGVAEWGCYGITIPGTLTSFGTGQINTNLVISGCSSRPIAASLCSDLTIGNYSDWFLPSLDELVLMQANLHQNGIGNFLNNWYWSSSQGGVTYPAPLVIFYNAWTVNFTDGTANLDGHFTKMAVLNVRAIRSF